LLTEVLQRQIATQVRAGRMDELPPTLTFQSVVDFTVSTRALVDALYAQLPANGSELVLFDINRSSRFGPLLRAGSETALARLLPAPPRKYRTTILTNASPESREIVERVTEAGETTEQTRPLDLLYPLDVFSLSHIALPFPVDDALYGMLPDRSEDFGVNLGALALRGERGTLLTSLDSLVRMSSNPFFPYELTRIDEGVDNVAFKVPPPSRRR
jgi:alpha-beta hydrolase superfamily lysophospholipase